MSRADAERFVIKARTNDTLQNELKKVVGISAVVEVANKHGAKITEADMRAYLAGDESHLTEKELEGVVGGSTNPTSLTTLTWGLADNFP
jgi:predicted ribosomally synthesized peptide with nif11-like leader